MVEKQEEDWGWLDFGDNYVPHDYQFDSPDFFNFLKKRKYATYFDAERDGYIPRTKDFFLLMAQFTYRTNVLIANHRMIAGLRSGKTNDGAPLVASDAALGYKAVGLREFRVIGSEAVEQLRSTKLLQGLLDGGAIFEAESGAYVEIIEVYAHPAIASHLKKTIADTYAKGIADWKRETRKPSLVKKIFGLRRREH